MHLEKLRIQTGPGFVVYGQSIQLWHGVLQFGTAWSAPDELTCKHCFALIKMNTADLKGLMHIHVTYIAQAIHLNRDYSPQVVRGSNEVCVTCNISPVMECTVIFVGFLFNQGPQWVFSMTHFHILMQCNKELLKPLWLSQAGKIHRWICHVV